MKLRMASAGGVGQNIARARIVVGEKSGVSERLKCQNGIQVKKLWNVFHKWRVGKGGYTDWGPRWPPKRSI